MNERERAERILTNLSSIGEDLLAFSDDLWQGTNYRDPKERERRLQVIDEYNSQLDSFAGIAGAIESMIRQAAGIPGENGHHPVPSGPLVEKHQEHTIDEDFTFTRPLGFAFRGQTYKDTLTWKQLYEALCRILADLDPDRWAAVPSNPVFTSAQNRKAFSRDPRDLRGPLPAIRGVYPEAHYSANSIRDNIAKLLTAFGISQHELKIYLRQERDARADVA